MEWANAWNDLFDLTKGRWNVRCMLPDYSVISVDDCQGWLQDSAYSGFRVAVRAGFVLGRPGILATRWPAGEMAPSEPEGSTE